MAEYSEHMAKLKYDFGYSKFSFNNYCKMT